MPAFSKQERLKSRKTIARLFKEGNSFVAYPMRVVWLEAPSSPPIGGGEASSPLPLHEKKGVSPPPMGGLEGVQVAVSVSKKNFKTAVARNRIKRRIREAYRLHKENLYEKLGERQVALMLIYVAKEELAFSEIEAGVEKMIRKFPPG